MKNVFFRSIARLTIPGEAAFLRGNCAWEGSRLWRFSRLCAWCNLFRMGFGARGNCYGLRSDWCGVDVERGGMGISMVYVYILFFRLID